MCGISFSTIYAPHTCRHSHSHTLTSSHSSYPPKHTLTHLLTYKHLLTYIYMHRLTYIHIHHHTYHILTTPPHRNIWSYTHTLMLTETLTTSHTSTTHLYSNTLQRLVEGPETSFICIRSHSTLV